MAERMVTMSVAEIQQIIDCKVKEAVDGQMSQGTFFLDSDWTTHEPEGASDRKDPRKKPDTGERPSSSAAAAAPTEEPAPRRTGVKELTKLLEELDIAKIKAGYQKLKTEKEAEEYEPIFEATAPKMEIKVPKNVRDLDHWGRAVVMFGKHKGDQYTTVFDEDPSYVSWLTGRGDVLSAPAARDLMSYCLLRSRADPQSS